MASSEFGVLPFSLHVTLAQDYLPRHPGIASGVTLGSTITIGGLFTPLLGIVADHSTLRTALVPLIAMPALAWLALRRLPEPTRPRAAPGEHVRASDLEAGSSAITRE
jgi:FSR family fosmidomycin resistance protein-like MFS transporter